MLKQAIHNDVAGLWSSERPRFRSDSEIRSSHRSGSEQSADKARSRVAKELEETPAASLRACSGLSVRWGKRRQRIHRVRQSSHGTIPPYAHVGGLRHPTNPAPHGANRADVDRHEGNASEMAPLSRATGTWWTPPGQGSMALFSYQFVSGACRNVIRDSAPRDFLLRTRDPSTAADGARGAQRWILIGTCLQKAS